MDLKTWFDALTHAKILKMRGDPESQVLDCKLVGGEGDMKRTLATSISGFSNAQGGVLLWGVSARKDAAGVDCIDSFPGVNNPRQLATRFDELTPQAVSPGAPGVVHRAVVARGAAPGFVATFVPGSDQGPHMARFGEDRYYQRIGLSFTRMEPFQIADMFGRRARPILRVDTLKWNNFEYRVRIHNDGRGAAQGVFIQLKATPPFMRNNMGVDGNRNEVLPYQHHAPDGSWLHAGSSTDLLHPTMSVSVGGVWLAYDAGQLLAAGAVPEILEIEYKVGALDVQPESGAIKIKVR